MLRSFSLFVVALLALSPVGAQVSRAPDPYATLREALALSARQVELLEELERSKATANRSALQKIFANQAEIQRMLNSQNADALAVGRLEIECADLRKQITAKARTRDQALAILDTARRAKLTALQNALNLQEAAMLAARLGLVELPAAQFSDDVGY